ncbi:MAG: hypothetical protein ACK55I_02540, partial [bacterium]
LFTLLHTSLYLVSRWHVVSCPFLKQLAKSWMQKIHPVGRGCKAVIFAGYKLEGTLDKLPTKHPARLFFVD